MLIERICLQLNRRNVKYAIVGGHAVALHGAVRGTVDIDFVIQWSEKNLQNAELALQELGLESRLPLSANEIFSNHQHYIEERNLIAWKFYNPNQQEEQVDIIINYDLANKQPVGIQFRDTTIPVLDKDSLVEMKRASGREQDLLDVQALEKIRT